MALQEKQTARMPMDDEEIVALYWERNERAIEETDFKYKSYLLSIAYNVLHDRLDCEECLNDTYLGVWEAIPPTKPSSFQAFLTTVARRTAIKRYRRNLRKGRVPSELTVSLAELEEVIAVEDTLDAQMDAARIASVIGSFVWRLSERKRFIFMSRYYTASPIDVIAADLGVSRSTVNKELAAIRKALRTMLESEGILK